MKWSKTLALMMLAVFVLSIVPFVLAETEGSEVRIQNKEMKEKILEKGQEIKAKAEEIRDNKGEFFKERIEKAKESYEAKKQELEAVKDKVNACHGENKNVTECQDKKSELKRGVQQHLLSTIELIDSSYERIKERVTSSNTLSEEQKQQALDKIAQLQEQLSAQKIKVESLAENGTNTELKEAIKELKSLWQDTKKIQNRVIAQLTNSKLDEIVKKQEEYYNALQLRINSLSSKGIEVSELQSLAEQFQQQTNVLKEDKSTAESAWNTVVDKTDLDLAKESNQKVKEDLEKSRELLKQFLDKYRELNRPVREHNLSEVENTTAEASA